MVRSYEPVHAFLLHLHHIMQNNWFLAWKRAQKLIEALCTMNLKFWFLYSFFFKKVFKSLWNIFCQNSWQVFGVRKLIFLGGFYALKYRSISKKKSKDLPCPTAIKMHRATSCHAAFFSWCNYLVRSLSSSSSFAFLMFLSSKAFASKSRWL